MRALVSKEFRSLLYSLSGIVFMVIFLIISGFLLWVVPGSYNIPENGYASMSAFFELAPVLLFLLIPALSMRVLAEEKRVQTLPLLMSRPVRLGAIVLSKSIAVFFTVMLSLIPTLLYVICIWWLGSPVGNLDLGGVAGSYAGLLFLIAVFVCISVFASSLTSSQVIALIVGMTLCAFFYWGFNLLSGLFSSGKMQLTIRELGLLSHYRSVQRGLVDSRDLFYMLAVGCLFFWLTLIVLKLPFRSSSSLFLIVLFGAFSVLSYAGFWQMDWTRDKRYTIRSVTRDLLKKIDSAVEVDVYLDGHLNPGFIRLQQSVSDLLDDFNRLSKGQIQYKVVNPYSESGFVEKLDEKGIRGIAVRERDVEGRASQQIIFPWVMIRTQDRELPVSLLVNQQGRSGEENLNLSIEMLEYQLAHSLEMLMQKETRKIVFLEGHGELEEAYVSDVSDELSRSCQIDRGRLSGISGELDDYSLVVVAGPQQPFSEQEKYVLDQYLMQGGRILWLVNGVRLQSPEALAEKGETVSMDNDVNLRDMLFTYGVRIDPVLLQDIQCLEIPVNTAGESADASFVPRPWYYAPLLLPNQDNPVTKGLIPLKTEFASTLSLLREENSGIRKQVLLSSSRHAHLIEVPEKVSLWETERQQDTSYFNRSYLPVSVLLEGVFPSVFKNRIINPDQSGSVSFRSESKPTRMIVVASEEVIRNELAQTDEGVQVLPAGYDRYSNRQFGNREFIGNAVNYLIDDSGLISLKSKALELQLLDKLKVNQNGTFLLVVNVILSPCLLILFFFILSGIRKRKYKRKSWS